MTAGLIGVGGLFVLGCFLNWLTSLPSKELQFDLDHYKERNDR